MTYDCIIAGAGPAGLSAALLLARYRRQTLIFHTNSPRNSYSHGVHCFLGHDGILPMDLLARGRAEVTKYGGLIVEGLVCAIRPSENGFAVDAATASQTLTFHSRRVLLATGLRDLTPQCPGFREFYGRSVFHCPDCDGFECSGKRILVYGRRSSLDHLATALSVWSQHLLLVAKEDQPVRSLEGDFATGQLRCANFEDGTAIDCDAFFFSLGTEPASDLHLQLGCRLDEASGLVWVNEQLQTSVRNVYAAGDLTPHSQLAIVAAAEGARAAVFIQKSLIQDA